MTNLAGGGRDDIRVWNTYLHWARNALPPSSFGSLDIDDPHNRLTATKANALRAVVFAAFALEYRIKRLYEELGVTYDQKEPLGALLSDFKNRVEATIRMDDGKPIVLAGEWTRLYARLVRLKNLRNTVAHAKFAELQSELGSTPSAMTRTAMQSYNAVVDFIRVSGQAIGYEPTTGLASRQYFMKLRLTAPKRRRAGA